MCGCNLYEVGNEPQFRIIGWVLLEHPAVIVAPLLAAWAATEMVSRWSKRRELQQQMAYERQETVFYRGEWESTLLRPASIPDNGAAELLRSREYAPPSDEKQMLRADACSHQAGLK